MQVQDVTLAADHCGRGHRLLQQRLLDQFTQRPLGRCTRPGAAGRRFRPHPRQQRREARQRQPLRALKTLIAQVKLGRSVEHREQFAEVAHALGAAQQQQPTRVERIVEQRQEPLLQLDVQVDQQVAAADQVEFGKRRVLDQVLLGENQHVADVFVDPVARAVSLWCKKPRQPLGRDVGRDTERKQPCPGTGHRLAVDVSGKDLHGAVLAQRLDQFLKQDRDRIGFLAGRATRRPDPDHAARRLTGKQLGQALVFERLESLGVAKKTGHADQHVAKQRLHLDRGLLQVLDVAVDRFDLVHRHSPGDAALDRAGLVLRKIMAGLGPQQHEDLLHRVLGLWRRRCQQPRQLAIGMDGVGDQLGRHLGGRQHIVDHAGGDRAARHAVELGRFGFLRHHHAGLALDRARAQRAVAAGAREHDADRALTLVLGQRAEEEIDRQALTPRRRGLQQLQAPVDECHVAVGRDDVSAVGLHHHAVLNLENLHPGVAPHQFAEQALVVRRQVLHQHEGHAGVGVSGHAGEKSLEGRQTTGRSADADHREIRRRWRLIGRRSRLVDRRCRARSIGGAGIWSAGRHDRICIRQIVLMLAPPWQPFLTLSVGVACRPRDARNRGLRCGNAAALRCGNPLARTAPQRLAGQT